MQILRLALKVGGTLLTALLIFTAHTMAQTSPTLSTLYNFTGSDDGGFPVAGVLISDGGTLSGTTSSGGTFGNGTVFSLKPPASPGGPWTEAVLHSFTGASGDGATPSGGLIIGSGPGGRPVLYGTTLFGGGSNSGTVFSLTPPTSAGGSWTETVLHSFTGVSGDGAYPSSMVIGPDGVLYGTTGAGGISACPTGGCGTVFSLTAPKAPGGAWTETVLYAFTGVSGDGSNPVGVAIGRHGVLYGATASGGTAGFLGTVFLLRPPTAPGSPWTETVLHSFTGSPSDGDSPGAGVVIGNGGVLYGTTLAGGTTNSGTVFSLRPPTSAGGSWTEAVLHNFSFVGDGAVPGAGVVIGSRGVLYGTTEYGGSGPCSGVGPTGCGTVFSLAPPASSGGAWTETVLHSFTGGSDGEYPFTAGVTGQDGVFYGTTKYGGSSNAGTVFSLRP
jgi:uncharacterized repeat protein (TIGR03803 family)